MMVREGAIKRLREILGKEDIPLNIPPKREMGDFSSAICLSLAKERKRPPLEIARETAASFKSNLPPFLRDVEVTPPGYLNFKVDWPGLASFFLPRIMEGERPVREGRVQMEKVFIEHTSVNPNKAMHIGHLRNAVLGDTVARVFQWLGHPVEVCNYIDDTGLQVVDVVTAFLFLDPPFYKEGMEDFSPFWDKAKSVSPFDYFCWDIYARFQGEIQRDPELAQKREGVLHQIEKGIHPIAFFAKELATRIVSAHLETVAQLAIFYDLLNWESDIIRRGFWNATFELMKEKGALRFEKEGPNEGCWVVPFGGLVETSEGVKSLDKILVRSNGSVTYTGKDIAYQLWKFGLLREDFHYGIWGRQASGKSLWSTVPDQRSPDPPHPFGHAGFVINVIDVRQSYPQQVVVECLRQTGFERQAERSVHLAYEVVNLSPQAARTLGIAATEEKKAVAMSGRLGTGVKARDFIDMVKKKVIEKADHPLDPEVASALASSAIRYYLLKFSLESQIIFDFDDALKTTGDTGVYLEYAHARACSILRKAAGKGIDLPFTPEQVPRRLTETERKLIECLSEFHSTVEKAGRTLRVSQLAEYAFQLASSFTDFYEHPDPEADSQIPFIHLEDQNLRTFRLSLVRVFQKVMGQVLGLMGMSTLERI